MQVANTILQQLGGRRFIAMTGAKNLIGGNDMLAFKLGFAAHQARGVSHVRITLLPSDLYKMEFLNIRGTNIKTVKVVEGVYCDQLQGIFTETTGLYTRL